MSESPGTKTPDSPHARPVSASQSERAEIIFPGDANPLGNLFGGRLMQFIDLCGAMAACRHSRAISITVSMDHIDFVAPVKVGDILILKASVNRAFNTSMEVGVKAMVEDVFAQTLRHVASAYLTFVAVDKHGERVKLAQIIPETDHQKRRFDDAGRRRELRSGEVNRKKDLRAKLTPEWHV
jgi:acyl-CoA hydrolase